MRPDELLVDAREMMRECYAKSDVKEVALALVAHAGQYVTALLNNDALASRAFLLNVVALGELLLARGELSGRTEG